MHQLIMADLLADRAANAFGAPREKHAEPNIRRSIGWLPID
jgi:hypothetical protein